MKKENWLIAVAAGVGVGALTYKLLSKNIPDGAVAVENFDINRYLGKWYEIARLPNRIEKGMVGLTENYSIDEAGNYTVVTKAYDQKKNVWKEFSGVLKFADNPTVGMLRVSYFRPIYSAYNILAIDPSYQFALVSGSSLNYLWILSKEAFIPEPIKNQFLSLADALGFEVEKLEWM